MLEDFFALTSTSTVKVVWTSGIALRKKKDTEQELLSN
jgi:hypothetical protein